MFTDDLVEAIAQAIGSEIVQPLGSMRLLAEPQEELALAILNALDAVGLRSGA